MERCSDGVGETKGAQESLGVRARAKVTVPCQERIVTSDSEGGAIPV